MESPEDIPTETLSIDVLVEPAENPNEMDEQTYALLVLAIKRVGFLQPVLVRPALAADAPLLVGTTLTLEEAFVIVDGVHRVRAAREAGRVTLPCVVTSLDRAEARAVQIGMNKMRGTQDLAVVARALAALKAEGWTSVELTVTGFPVDEVEALVRSTLASADDAVMRDPAGGLPEIEQEAPTVRPFLLELTFATRDELADVKKKLRKAAGGGRGADLSAGLLNLIRAEDAPKKG